MQWRGNEPSKRAESFTLPKLDEQADDAYNTYEGRALYYNATGRTVDAMSGLVFRKTMTVKVPDEMKPWLDNIALSDETLTGFAETSLYETLCVGRGGINGRYASFSG
ncbi:hypothetical protein GCM10010967_58010 [Dyadobacter beijingensis]|uniref:Uncharacterized protein n=1 Tax=Dyadobacter beijingensis TaxID=365489 RepID=A0ABQ2INN1_9BACT|nr:hypothetical protein GCM10010967_58010 [Dyadobacter beijingensis]